MRYIIDIDDTIARHAFRDYDNAEPIPRAVEMLRKIRRMSGQNVICLYTARGMVSCNGDVAEIERRYRARLEKWLKDNDIPYDELIFGKPYGDVYIDDKAVTAKDFESLGVAEYHGFSGARVIRVGALVVKESENALDQFAWYREAARRGFKDAIPDVYSATCDTLSLEHVAGVPLSTALTYRGFWEAITLLDRFRASPDKDARNDLEAYITYVTERADRVEVDFPTSDDTRVFDDLRAIFEKRTFSHGDFSTLNLIKTEPGLKMIDPSYKPFFSSYLLDASKLAVSLRGLDGILTGQKHDLTHYLAALYDAYSPEERRALRVLERTHVIRVLAFAARLGKVKERQLLRELLETI